MQTQDKTKKIVTVEDLRRQALTEPKHLSIFDDFDPYKWLRDLWAKPLGKLLITGGAAVGLIYVSGYGMDLAGWWLRKYHRFQNAANSPIPNPPSPKPAPPPPKV